MCLKSCFVLFLHFLFIINYSLSHIDGVTIHDKHTNTKIRWTGLNKFSQAGKRRVRILTRRSKLKVYTKLTVFQKNIRTTVVQPWQYKHEYNHTFKKQYWQFRRSWQGKNLIKCFIWRKLIINQNIFMTFYDTQCPL